MSAATPTLAMLIAHANARAAAGDRGGAIAAYREAVRVAPGRAELWHNLGALAALAGDRESAEEAFVEAARLRDDWAEPRHARGHVLFGAGDIGGACAAFEGAVARDPSHLGARVNLALMLNRLQRWREAVPHLFHARVLAPANETIWWTLRGNLLLLRRDEEALADFLAFEPHGARTARMLVAGLASARRLAIRDREARALRAVLEHAWTSGESELLAEVLAHVQYFDVTREALLALYRHYDRIVRAELAAAGDDAPLAPAPGRRDLGSRIRIGYLSADFRRHVMGELMAPVLARHDRARFDVRLYSLAPRQNEDALTAELRSVTEGFTALTAQDDAAAARTIAADRLDMLVDLMGHSAFARPGIVARRPAPVIATHLGYHGALGLACVDYKVTDDVADLPDAGAFQLERRLPLDVCVLPLRAFVAPAANVLRETLAIPPDAIVAATFVGVHKLSPRCLDLWQAVLAAAPRLLLLFSPPRDDDRGALARRLEGFGIAPSRCRFLAADPNRMHQRYALADFALDTLPYTGGDTTAAALGAGLPVVTRIGVRHAERMTASLLVHAGLRELVSESDADYVALATRLATDTPFLDRQRGAVRTALRPSALTDPGTYARALESAYVRALDARAMTDH